MIRQERRFEREYKERERERERERLEKGDTWERKDSMVKKKE